MKSRENGKTWARIIILPYILAFLLYFLSFQVLADSPLKEGGFATATPENASQYAAGEILVKFKDVVTSKQIGSINSTYGTSVMYSSPYAGFKRIKIPPDKTVPEMVELYRENILVEYAEPNYIAYAYWTPNDPLYSYQWHFPLINMPSAWDIDPGGNSGVIVTVLDSGVAYEDYGPYQRAPDLAGTNFLPGYDFVNNDFHPNDDNGHGTHVSGTIAQTTNNSLGVAGIAFNCSIMPVKVLGADGSGTYQQIADGIYYAVDSGAMVINCSLGGSSSSSTMYDAVQYAYRNGVVMVAATGNDNSIIGYPARYDECIAVGAVDINKARAYYSNYGTGMELMAPGGDTSVDLNGDGYVDGVLQLTFSGGDPTNFGYWFWQGTSMATPHVTGLIALIQSGWAASGIENSGPSRIENIRDILHSTAEDLGPAGYDTVYGYGLIDAVAALSEARAVVLEVEPSSLDFGEAGKSSSKTMTLRVYNAGTGILSGTISDNRSWISVSSTNFEGNDNTIFVTVETGGLPESKSPYTGTVTLASNGGTKTVDVSVTVIPSGAVAYPNPVSVSDSTITFWGTSIPNAQVRIYTLTGELVRTLTEAYGDSSVSWDGRNDKGNLVARGVYYYTVRNFRGKFVVK